jgi:hypothetical protein
MPRRFETTGISSRRAGARTVPNRSAGVPRQPLGTQEAVDFAGVARPPEVVCLRGPARQLLRAAINARAWSALFVDVGLPDGSGLDAIAHARASQNWVPALQSSYRAEGEIAAGA